MRVLIAEDSPVSRKLLERTLSQWGFEPVVCIDGKEALAALQSPDTPDIALLDWMMPELDGPEVCRRIRQTPSQHPKYIILLTSKTERGDLITGLQAGADDYVTKPFDAEELRARLSVGVRVVGLQKDLSEKVAALEIAMTRLSRHQQNQRLEAIGRLASGVAHEINTPMQYIGDNVRFLRESLAELTPAIRMLLTLPEALPTKSDPDELAYALKEMPKAIAQSLEGIDRVTKIVHAMRDFAHPCDDHKSLIDLNRAIETTITIARNEWKYVAEVVTEFDENLPEVLCLPGEIQQAVLALLVNASQAITEIVGNSGQRGVIKISTARRADVAEIVIADTGKGIPAELREKIFEPFFTTRDTGKGTGHGLTIARSIIVQRHGGKIWLEGDENGTTFFIHLPLNGKEAQPDELIFESTSIACR